MSCAGITPSCPALKSAGTPMTYYRDLLNEKFFLVDTVYDAEADLRVI